MTIVTGPVSRYYQWRWPRISWKSHKVCYCVRASVQFVWHLKAVSDNDSIRTPNYATEDSSSKPLFLGINHLPLGKYMLMTFVIFFFETI